MKREIVISATPQETRVAILEDDTLVELMVDRPDTERIVGDVYLGQVQAVLPGIQAAFIDIGLEKAAFLHASDVSAENGMEEENGDDDDDDDERERRNTRPIQELIEKGALGQKSNSVGIYKKDKDAKGQTVILAYRLGIVGR